MAKTQTETPPAEPKPRRAPNPEIQVMAKIDALLATLTDEQADRVTIWARSKYFPANYARPQQTGPQTPPSTEPPK